MGAVTVHDHLVRRHWDSACVVTTKHSVQFNLFHFPMIHYKVVNHMDIEIVRKYNYIYKVLQITVKIQCKLVV